MTRSVILQVLDFVPEGNRTMEQFLLGLARRLKQQGWCTVHVFAGEPSTEFRRTLRELDSPYFVSKFPLSLKSAVTLGRMVRQYQPAVIQTTFLSKFTPALWILKRTAGANRLIITDQSSGTVSRRSPLGSAAARLRGWCAARYVEKIIAVSDFVRNRDVLDVHFPAAQLRRVYSGVDMTRFVPTRVAPNETCTIVYVGQLIPQKGVLTLLRAVKLLMDHGATLRVVIAGAGRQEEELKRFCEDATLKTQVEFIGQYNKVEELFSRADVVVVPSEWAEAFGFVAAEALASGACLIVSDAGGLPEIVGRDQKAGVIFSRGDVDDLATKLSSLMGDPERRATMRSAARERALSLFSLDSMIDGYWECLNESRAPEESRPVRS